LAEYSISFEFFPPRNEHGIKELVNSAKTLRTFKPEYFSVTFGAGGGTTKLTFDTSKALLTDTDVEVAPHISCTNIGEEVVFSVLNSYLEAGMRRLVVLRGDKPSGMPLFTDFPFASDLIQLIRKEYGASFFIDVAAYPEMHPESPSLHSDMSNFRTKVESGADRAITQFFFNCDAYFRFLDDCEKYGVDVPVIAGLMPITESKGLRRFSERCGTEIPRWILNRMEHYEEDSSSLQKFGVDVLSRMCSTLIDGGVPGLHFFTLNKTYSVSRICANLGLMD